MALINHLLVFDWFVV